MADLSVPSIRERLFNTSRHEQRTSRNSSNPFAANTFKGNVLTADVFESSTAKNNTVSQPSFTGKLKASALVGSISGIGEKFQNIIKSVAAFGNRMKENVVNGWNKLNEIEITFNPLKERMSSALNSVKEVMSMPMSDLMMTGVKPARYYEKMTNMEEARLIMADAVGNWEASLV